MSEIKVSVCCLVFNHEKYLRKCLDGFVNQKTNFKYEVLIHDDASTDSSQQIIREYEEKFPEIIKPIYQTENQHSKGVRITYMYQFPRVKGKYIAMCEGDDFWLDENKLQKQYDMMEANPNCSICVHKVQYVSNTDEKLETFMPEQPIQSQIYSGEQIVDMALLGNVFFQTSSYFLRSEYSGLKDRPSFLMKAPIGDLSRLLYLANCGDCCYLDEIMSCYRVGVDGSWTDRYKKDINFRINTISKIRNMYIGFDEYTGGKYKECVDKAVKRKDFDIYLIEMNAKKICSKKYRELFKKLSFKKRLAYTVICIFPFMKSVAKRVRKQQHLL